MPRSGVRFPSAPPRFALTRFAWRSHAEPLGRGPCPAERERREYEANNGGGHQKMTPQTFLFVGLLIRQPAQHAIQRAGELGALVLVQHRVEIDQRRRDRVDPPVQL